MRQTFKNTAKRLRFSALYNSSALYRTAFASTMAVAMVAGGDAHALPTDPSVESGSVNFQQPDSKNLIVNQGSDRAIINWSSFDILHGESTRFVQPNANSVALNRITNGNPTQILGTLSANGKLVLVNPNGVFFGAGSKVDVAGLIASTADISSKNFLAGTMKFDQAGKADASIINKGTITAADGGLVALVAPGVRNDGIIQANLGTVALASGSTATIDMYGDNLYSFAVGKTTSAARDESGNKMDSAVENNGTVRATGGKILLTANAAKDVVTNVVNNTGVLEASAARVVGGTVILDGGDSGNVQVAGTVTVAGSKAGQKGGNVTITGETVKLVAAAIDASGDAAGGTVLVGGDYQGGGTVAHAKSVDVDSASVINVSATGNGDAGTAVIWSDDATSFAGTLLGTGGALGGNGGQFEVSSMNTLDYSGLANASAVAGKSGMLLLDPLNINVGPVLAFAAQNALNLGTDVTIFTPVIGPQAGNITVNSEISWFGLGSLTLNAINNIIINANITSTTLAGTGNNGAIRLTAGNNVRVDNATLQAARGDVTVTGERVTLLNGFIQALRGNIDIHNANAFFSNTANALSNDAAGTGHVYVNQTENGSIQNAVDAIGTTGTGGGKVTLASGDWHEQVFINQGNFTLTGQGATSVIHAPLETELNHYITTHGKDITPVVYVTDANAVTVSNLAVDATGTTASTGIAFNHANDGFIRGTTVSNIDGDGILLEYARYSTVQGNSISNTAAHMEREEGNGIRAWGATGSIIGGDNPEDGNTITNAGWDGIKITGGLWYTIKNNVIDTTDRVGIFADGMSFSTIANNVVTNTLNNAFGYGAINVNGASNDITIADNQVYNVGDGSGIRLNTVGGTNYITGNQIGTTSDDGIQVVHSTNVFVSGNSIGNTGRDGMHFEDDTNIHASNNTIHDTEGHGIYAANLYVDGSGLSEAKLLEVSEMYGYPQNIFSHNTIYNASGDGIHLAQVYNSYVADNTIHDVSGHGVFGVNLYTTEGSYNDAYADFATQDMWQEEGGWYAPGQTIVAGNEIYGTGLDGIHLDYANNIVALDNLIHDIGLNGINLYEAFVDYATSTIVANNEIFRTGQNGIKLNYVTNAYVVDNTIHDIGGGVPSDEESEKTVVKAFEFVAADGIHATNLFTDGSGGSITVKASAVEGDEESYSYGSEYYGQPGSTVISYNDIYNVAHDGIHVEYANNANINNNTVWSVGNDGIYAYNLTAGSEFSGSKKTKEILIPLAAAETYVTNNYVYDVGHDGIHLEYIANANVTDNEVFQTGNDGIYAYNLYREVGDIWYPFDSFVTVAATGVSDISWNEVYSVGHDGIHLDTIQNAHVTYNTVHDLTNDGIYAANLYVAGNKGGVVDEPPVLGISEELPGDSIPGDSLPGDSESLAYESLIANNEIFGIGHDGIHIEGIQNGLVTENTVHDVTHDGIFASQSGFVGEDTSEGGDEQFTEKSFKSYGDGSGSYDNAVFSNNMVYSAGGDGIHLVTMSGASVLDNSLVGFGNAGLHAEYSNNLTVAGNYSEGSPFGMQFDFSFAPVISGNTLVNNGIGIDLHISDSASLSGDIFTGNTLGINLHDNFFTRIENETITTPFFGVGLRIAENSLGTVVKDTTFNGGNIAIEITDPGSAMAFEGNNSAFTGQNFYFVLQNGAMVGETLDASQQIFDGTSASSFTQEQLADAEGRFAFDLRTIDVADDASLGDVFYGDFTGQSFDLSVLDDFQNSKRNAYRRGNFSYAGRVFSVTPNAVEPTSFDLASINLSLLNRASPTAAADVANLFATLAPAAGGNKKNPTDPKDLANLTPGAGGPSAQSFAALSPAAGGGVGGSCGNSFLGDGYASGFSCSANQ